MDLPGFLIDAVSYSGFYDNSAADRLDNSSSMADMGHACRQPVGSFLVATGTADSQPGFLAANNFGLTDFICLGNHSKNDRTPGC